MLFCTVTALGLVRLVCQPKLMGAAVKTAGEASALRAGFCQQPGVSMASAEQAGWKVFHLLLRSGELLPSLFADAYLAALAITNGAPPHLYQQLLGSPARRAYSRGTPVSLDQLL